MTASSQNEGSYCRRRVAGDLVLSPDGRALMEIARCVYLDDDPTGELWAGLIEPGGNRLDVKLSYPADDLELAEPERPAHPAPPPARKLPRRKRWPRFVPWIGELVRLRSGGRAMAVKMAVWADDGEAWLLLDDGTDPGVGVRCSDVECAARPLAHNLRVL